ncbi:hypothetical protein [Methylorubrum sp. SB2]|uniref:hypothetical protein n=1 Tax=Methylorubrum subtropicum TaxID=3138812 RepID=UPI00313DD73D
MLRRPEIFGRLFVRGRTTVYAASALSGVAAGAAVSGAGMAGLVAALCLCAAGTVLLPRYVRRGIALEDALNLRTGLLLPGRAVRAAAGAGPVLAGLSVPAAASAVPGVVWLGLLLCLASAGTQAFAARLAYRGRGDRVSNAVLAYAPPLWSLALALHPATAPLGLALLAAAAGLFAVDLVRGLGSDHAARSRQRGGIGLFFGTFNPVHRTHIDIIATAIRTRGLERVYVHPTTVPKLHRDALASGELRYDHRDGMRVYARTAKADPNRNYFPTGNMFYEYEVRNELLKASIRDAGLDGVVQVLERPALYEREGFLGLARHIQSLHPGSRFHGLHGSDPGGMWVRNIFEACGRIVPYPVPRTDRISATAIRKGATGMTTPTVERFLAAVRGGQGFTFPSGLTFPSGFTDRPGDPSAPERAAPASAGPRAAATAPVPAEGDGYLRSGA